MKRLRGLARRLGLRRALKRALGALGFDVVTRNFYSPVPDLRALPADTWTRASPLRGLTLDLDAQLAFLEDELAPFLAEPELARFAPAFDTANTTYAGVDAETLYAVVRRFRPRRILELGSGESTLIAAAARVGNERDGVTAHQLAFDPHARADLRPALAAAAELRPVSAADVGDAEVTALAAGDVLFVDSTHTVKIGSEVNHVVLDLLPLVAPGVLVHFHDVFWPYEYPRAYFTELDVAWNEQYLLQAFLSGHPGWEILLANHALWRDRRERISALATGRTVPTGPSALWLRRR